MIHIRPMTESDVPFGVQLKEQAGWNQTADDWRRFRALQPDGCFVAEWDGRPAGTTVACVFGPGVPGTVPTVAWIAMVLVDVSCRGRGIATRLMEHALAFLDARGVRSVRLDATPLGEPVYRKLGFVRQYELRRWAGVATPDPSESVAERGTAGGGCATLDAEHFADVCRFDQETSGCDRRRFLESLWFDQPETTRIATGPDGVDGYAFCREGARAVLVGPVAARSDASGRALLAAMFRALAGRPVFVDVPIDHRAAVDWVAARGLVVQRPLVRMLRGESVAERPAWRWASSGPELG